MTSSLISGVKIYTDIFSSNSVVDNEFIQLKEVQGFVPKDNVILVKTKPFGETHLVSYFLRNHRISLGSNSYLGSYDSIPSNGTSNYVLESNLNINDGVLIKEQKIIWQNNRFTLFNEPYYFQFGRGFYNLELNGAAQWRWLSSEAIFYITPVIDEKIQLSLNFNTIAPTSRIDEKNCRLFLNDVLVGNFVVGRQGAQVKFDEISISKDHKNEFKIVVEGGDDIVPPDPRKLSLNLAGITLSINN
jgi:hypothetical protein